MKTRRWICTGLAIERKKREEHKWARGQNSKATVSPSGLGSLNASFITQVGTGPSAALTQRLADLQMYWTELLCRYLAARLSRFQSVYIVALHPTDKGGRIIHTVCEQSFYLATQCQKSLSVEEHLSFTW